MFLNNGLSSPLSHPPTTPTAHAHSSDQPQDRKRVHRSNNNNLLNLSISSPPSSTDSSGDDYLNHDITTTDSNVSPMSLRNTSSLFPPSPSSTVQYNSVQNGLDETHLQNDGITFREEEQCMTNFNAKYISPVSDDGMTSYKSGTSRDGVDYFRCKRLKLKQVSANIKFKEIFEMVKQIPPPVTLTLSLTPKDIYQFIPDPPRFKTEPQSGLHPKHVDLHKYNQIRMNDEKTRFKLFVPSKYVPHLPPLKRFDQFMPIETLNRPEDLYNAVPLNIQKIVLENIRVKTEKFHQRISSFQYCSVLVMRNMYLDSLVGIKLPLLRVLDVRFNLIASCDQMTPMLKESPFLEHLVVMDNPLEKIPNYRQILIGNCPRIISFNGQTVLFGEKETCNDLYGSETSKSTFSFLRWDERMNNLCESLQLESWQPESITVLSLSNAKLSEIHVGSMVNLCKLDVSNNQLKTLVGCGLERLDKLKEFNVNYNHLSNELELNVLTYIPSLRYLWICENPFPKTPSTSASSTTNGEENSSSDDSDRIWYLVVFLTINLKGNNRNVGLLELDDTIITIDHRLKAIKKYSPSVTDDDLRRLRWNYNLINHYGHHQLRKLCNGQFMSIVTKLVLTDCHLTLADLNYFVSLEYIDLHGNNLLKIIGLEKLKNLRFIDVSGNPKLNRDEVTQALGKLSSLIHVSLATDLTQVLYTSSGGNDSTLNQSMNSSISVVTTGGSEFHSPSRLKMNQHSRSPHKMDPSLHNSSSMMILNPHSESTEFVRRFSILKILLDKNDKLLVLDNIRIDVVERSRVIKELRDLSEIEELKYRYHLSIILQVVTNPFTDKVKLSYRDIVPGKLYDPQRITKLYLRECGLKDVGTDLSPFVNLTLLDLSHNMINNVLDIGLQKCCAIKYLDLGYNNISNKLADIVNIINRMTDLEMISIHGNPEIEKVKNYKIKILKELNLTDFDVNPKLVIFNTKITSQERQMIWEEKVSRSLSPIDMSFESRLQRIIEEKGYNKKDPLSITEINLNESGISVLGDFLSKLPRVEKLLLRGNQFCERLSKSCSGILSLRYLRVLDVRNNKLTDLEDLIFIVNQNVFLECLGVYSPPDENDDANYPKMTEQQVRQAIISRTPRLANIYCPFWEIDEKEITIDEIMNYWPYNNDHIEISNNKKLFRFHHSLFMKYIQSIQEFDISQIQVQSHTIVSLDLSNSKLVHVDFTNFVNLKKLSLRNNLLDDDAFNGSGLYHTPIEQLDLQHNCIEHLETISKFIDEKMNTLHQLYLIYNPCFKMKQKDRTLIAHTTENQAISPGLNVSLNDMEQVLLVNPSIVECSSEYIASRRKLISLLKSSKNPKWSFMLDGLYVSVSERCESISKQVTIHELETIRLELILNESKYSELQANTTTSITLNFKGLILLNFDILSKYQNLIHLDLRGNSIKQLDRRIFKTLRKLHYLDLRDNDLSTSEQDGVLNVIGECHSLRVLYLQRCGKDIFLEPFEYHVRVFSTLRLLVSVDDVMNPFPLSKSQLLAIQYLENNYQLSPNSLSDIVIEIGIESNAQFWTVLLALSCLVTLYDSKNTTKVGNMNRQSASVMVNQTSSITTRHDETAILTDSKVQSSSNKAITPPPLTSSSNKACTRSPSLSSPNTLTNTSQFDLIGPKSIHFSSIQIPIQDYRFLLLSHVRTLEQVDGSPVHSNEKIHISVEISKLRDLMDRKYSSSLDTSLSMIRPVLTYSTVKKSILAQIKKEAATNALLSQVKNTSMISGRMISDDEKRTTNTPRMNIIESTNGSHDHTSKRLKNSSVVTFAHPIPIIEPQTIDAPIVPSQHGSTSLLTTDKRSHLFLNDPYDALVPFKFIQDNFDNISIIQYYRQLLNIRNQMGDVFEGFLNRIEMILFSLQLFAICFSFTIPWPQYFTMVVKWVVLSIGSIDLLWNTFHVNNYYFKYSIEMMLPLLFLVLLLWNPSFDRLKLLFVKKLGYTLLSSVLMTIILVVIGTLLALTVFPQSYQSILQGKAPNVTDVWIVLGVILILIISLWIMFLIYMILFRLKYQNYSFFYSYLLKSRQRVLFLLFTFFYFIALRDIIATFECQQDFITIATMKHKSTWIDYIGEYNTTSSSSISSSSSILNTRIQSSSILNNSTTTTLNSTTVMNNGTVMNNTLRIYKDETCPLSFYNPLLYPIMYWVSIGFGILYCLFLPLFFMILIHRNSNKWIQSLKQDERLLHSKKIQYTNWIKKDRLEKKKKNSSNNSHSSGHCAQHGNTNSGALHHRHTDEHATPIQNTSTNEPSSQHVVANTNVTTIHTTIQNTTNATTTTNGTLCTTIQDSISKEERKLLLKSIHKDERLLERKYVKTIRQEGTWGMSVWMESLNLHRGIPRHSMILSRMIPRHSMILSRILAWFQHMFRYQHVLYMMERIVLCVISSFLNTHTWIQAPIASGLLFLMGLYCMVLRPYAELSDSLSSGIIHLLLTFNVLFGYYLLRMNDLGNEFGDSWILSEQTQSIVLYVVNGVGVLGVCALLFLTPLVRKLIWMRRNLYALSYEDKSHGRYSNSTFASSSLQRSRPQQRLTMTGLQPISSLNEKRLSKRIQQDAEMKDYAYENSYFDMMDEASFDTNFSYYGNLKDEKNEVIEIELHSPRANVLQSPRAQQIIAQSSQSNV
ncbi:hypothetical protein C9374_008640 [Naegleria lovaniensis]|uniref:Uncharacterized protein n=1 Tax=Naegleria lovaniensis TaxID=51637 RepID=A0AA88GGB8_NAELO|nr:uncharacterized protein C9374_008640 [Naegleria lovaniensis]KAG2378018.1 hypothetical protein C9374_008640 [Naegleria lovaniensis]